MVQHGHDWAQHKQAGQDQAQVAHIASMGFMSLQTDSSTTHGGKYSQKYIGHDDADYIAHQAPVYPEKTARTICQNAMLAWERVFLQFKG